MYNFTPIPSWTELTFGLFSSASKTKQTMSPWSKHEDQVFWFSKGASILDYVVNLHATKTKSTNTVIWLPDYFCNSALQLVRKRQVSVKFYPINSMFDPEWDICEDMIENICAPDIFVLVHYFGRLANVSRAAKFCCKHQVMLLEDSAHVLFPYGEMGSYGDGIFYCPHKVLPAPDGAILSGSILSSSPALKTAPFPATWLLKKFAQQILPPSVLRYRTQALPDFWTDRKSLESPAITAISSIGYNMISMNVNRLRTIGETRKEAAAKWRDAFLPHNDLCSAALSIEEEGPAPYRFVLRFKDAEAASNIFAALRVEGVAVESWPDLPPSVKETEPPHHIACELRKTLLFLPIFNPLPPSLSSLVDSCVQNCRRRGLPFSSPM